MSLDKVVQYVEKLAHILDLNYNITNGMDYLISFEKSNIKYSCTINPTIPEKHIKYKIKVTAFQVLERLVEKEAEG